MKKTAALILALITLILLCSCGSGATEEKKETGTQTATVGGDTTTETVISESSDGTVSEETGVSETETAEPTAVTPTQTSEPTVVAPTETSEPTEKTETPPASVIHAVYVSTKNNYTVEKEGETVSLKATKRPAVGDKLTVNTPTDYLKISNKVFGEVILYLPDMVFTYVYQSSSEVFMPSQFCGSTVNMTFSTPTIEELEAKRNLALNPYDFTKDSVGFPHAASNNVYDQSGQFIPRNAIDGYTSNKGHGNYPLESWGPNSTVRNTDHYTVDFGREVEVDSVVLYLRADGFGTSHSHDAYFSTIVLEFSNGTSVTVNPEKKAEGQTFTFDPVKTSYVKLTGFVTDKTASDGWAAITEVQVMGSDVFGMPELD